MYPRLGVSNPRRKVTPRESLPRPFRRPRKKPSRRPGEKLGRTSNGFPCRAGDVGRTPSRRPSRRYGRSWRKSSRRGRTTKDKVALHDGKIDKGRRVVKREGDELALPSRPVSTSAVWLAKWPSRRSSSPFQHGNSPVRLSAGRTKSTGPSETPKTVDYPIAAMPWQFHNLKVRSLARNSRRPRFPEDRLYYA